MPEISDEILMAYADGMLDAGEAECVRDLVQRYPDLAGRLRAFERTGHALLGRVYEPVLRAPVPDRLIATVRSAALVSRPLRTDRSAGVLLWDRAIEAISTFVPRPQALMLGGVAAVAVLIAVAGLPPRAPHIEGANAYVALENGRPVAAGEFRDLLETQPSGKLMLAEGKSVAGISLSFRSKEGDYCRVYELQMTGEQPVGGIACRTAPGAWEIDTQALIEQPRIVSAAPLPGKPTVAAGGESSIDERYYALLAEGGEIAKETEQNLLNKSWVSQP